MIYQIEVKDEHGQWTPELGDANEFASVAEAQVGIQELIALGDEFATSEYRVTEKEWQPHPFKRQPHRSVWAGCAVCSTLHQ